MSDKVTVRIVRAGAKTLTYTVIPSPDARGARWLRVNFPVARTLTDSTARVEGGFMEVLGGKLADLGYPAGPAARKYPCQHCGQDIGWNAPSGVCSTACLNAAQGFARALPEALDDDGAVHPLQARFSAPAAV